MPQPERTKAQQAASYIRQIEGMRVSLLFIEELCNIPTAGADRALDTIGQMMRDWIKSNHR